MTQRPESPASEQFVHLYAHVELSLLDGLNPIGEMTHRVVADQGMKASATGGNAFHAYQADVW